LQAIGTDRPLGPDPQAFWEEVQVKIPSPGEAAVVLVPTPVFKTERGSCKSPLESSILSRLRQLPTAVQQESEL